MRSERTAILQEVKAKLAETDFVFVADHTGITVGQSNALRRDLRKLETEIHVVKNTYLGLAARELDMPDLSDFLTGPTSVITGRGDLVEVAKVLSAFLKDKNKAAVKGGCLDGELITSADIDALAKMPPREQMLGMFVGTVAAPMQQLVGVMNQKLLSVLYALKAVESKKNEAA